MHGAVMDGVRQRRWSWVLVVAALLALGVVSPAAAHGGKIAIRSISGQYGIEAAVSRNAGQIDETITVWDTTTGQAAAIGLVVLTLTGPDGQMAGPFTAQAVNGVAELHYPPPRGDGWTVHITIPTRGGPPIELSHRYVSPPAWWQQAEYASLLLLAAVLVPVLIYRRWKRGRQHPDLRGDPSPI